MESRRLRLRLRLRLAEVGGSDEIRDPSDERRIRRGENIHGHDR
jgi:hypothetical protein